MPNTGYLSLWSISMSPKISPQKTSLSAGIALMLIATIFFAMMNALVKYLAELGYSSMENVFFRAFFMVVTLYCILGLFPILKPIMPRLKKPVFKPKKQGGFSAMLMRSLFGAVAVGIAYYNVATIPLGIAVAFLQSSPIFVVFLSFFTRNKPGLFVSLATLIGFLGVLFIANPQTSNIPLINAILGIIGAISAAIAFLTIPSLKSFYTPEAVSLWYGFGMCVVGVVGMMIPVEKMGGFSFPDTTAWILFALSGITGAIGQYCMTKSYMFAPPGIVAPIAYMRIVWSLLFGIALGDALPDFFPSLGIFLIIVSGVLVALPVFIREYKKLAKTH